MNKGGTADFDSSLQKVRTFFHETKVVIINMLFRRKAVLIIHGFAGGLKDNEYLATELEFTGKYDVFTFTLPGHHKDTLKTKDYHDWIDKSKRMVERIQEKYHTIYLVGHSMGGVIASYLATQYPIKKLVLVAPAFEYLAKDRILEDIKNLPKKKQEKEVDTLYSHLAYNLLHVSLSSALAFTRLVKDYHDCPKQIECPTLILHGVQDEVVPISASYYVYNALASKRKKLIPLDDTRHNVFRTEKREEAAIEVKKFLGGI